MKKKISNDMDKLHEKVQNERCNIFFQSEISIEWNKILRFKNILATL